MPPLTRRALIGWIWGATEPIDRTLVCVFLRGGADTLSLVVPFGDDRYGARRPTVGVRPPAELRLDGFYGFHPSFAPLMPAFREGRLGIVQSVGTDNPTGSHFDAQDQLEHGEAYGAPQGGGWVGRYLRARVAQSPLAGVGLGIRLPEALRGAPSATAFASLDELQLPGATAEREAFARGLGALYAAEGDALGEHGRESLAVLARVEGLRTRGAAQADIAARYPDSPLGRGLHEVARLIHARVGLEVACVDSDGWDTHFVQGGVEGLLAGRADDLARGLAAFDADVARAPARVTVLVFTEFGRRTYENASGGTDHGRAFSLLALGPDVAGGKVHGPHPELDETATPLPGPGGVPVQVDVRSVFAEVLKRGLGFAELDRVFPGFAPGRVGLMR